MSECSVVNEAGSKIPEDIITRCSKEVMDKHLKRDASCTIVFVPPEKMQALNKEHYKKDAVTDVLSFESGEDEYIGEVIICPSYIKEIYPENRYLWELCHAVVHGTFHLAGFHHEDSEEDHQRLHLLEEEIINNILS